MFQRHTTGGNHLEGNLVKQVACVGVCVRTLSLKGLKAPRMLHTLTDISFLLGRKRCSVLGWCVVVLSGCILHECVRMSSVVLGTCVDLVFSAYHE